MPTLTNFFRTHLRPATLAFLLAAALVAFIPIPALAAPTARTIRVEAGGYAYLPEVIQVNPGDRVTIELVATDVAHGLAIDGYPVDLHGEPGQTARVTFVVDRPGSFKM